LFLGIFLLLAPVPWDLGPCPVEAPQQQTDYRQTFQHDSAIVPQKYIDSI